MKFNDYLAQQMQDAQFKAEYDALAPQYEIIRTVIAERDAQHLTQKELAQRCGIKQSNISRLENGNANPSLAFLQKIAKGFGKELHIEFR
ncbi:MAG: XRE family transcriptional regulator [Clostridia bacterium]|jgi:predicted transcriptional regulator|nr:XRE family transcriptional regulator [Clostridia bacterium]NLS85754.1 helix-turn-helix transcriptional regulator [Oscillospiraceae bacterium]